MQLSYSVKLVVDRYAGQDPQHVAAILRGNTFVSLLHRYMYVSVSKAACTTMKWLLHSLHNGPPLHWTTAAHRNMLIHHRENVPLPAIVDLDDDLQRDVLHSPDFLRMTIVRNPYTRLVSAWRNKLLTCEPGYAPLYLQIKGKQADSKQRSRIYWANFDPKPPVSFSEFVEYLEAHPEAMAEDGHWTRQTDQTFIRALNYSWIGKVERLSETLDMFQRHLGRTEPFNIKSANVSGGPKYLPYDQRLAKTIASLYRSDFEQFGYDPAVWPFESGGSDSVSLEHYIDEVTERNIIIAHLAAECQRLQSAGRPVPRTPRNLIRFLMGRPLTEVHPGI